MHRGDAVSDGGKAQWAYTEEQAGEARKDDEGQYYEGREVKSHTRRIRWKNKGGVDHEQAESARAVRGEIRRKGRGGVDGERVYERLKIHICTRSGLVTVVVPVCRELCTGRIRELHRKWKTVDVSMTECASYEACKAPACQGGSRAAGEGK
ncbi:hypothetical protein K438DRAFT_2149987 [Mycena galopus ATCC 62051]|nr:hypothetical protein K438DRAFT_2149987 [Mycena galopus ATCC 62051]